MSVRLLKENVRDEKQMRAYYSETIVKMIEDGKPIEVNCHFCNTNYVFSVEELKEILRKCR